MAGCLDPERDLASDAIGFGEESEGCKATCRADQEALSRARSEVALSGLSGGVLVGAIGGLLGGGSSSSGAAVGGFHDDLTPLLEADRELTPEERDRLLTGATDRASADHAALTDALGAATRLTQLHRAYLAELNTAMAAGAIPVETALDRAAAQGRVIAEEREVIGELIDTASTNTATYQKAVQKLGASGTGSDALRPLEQQLLEIDRTLAALNEQDAVRARLLPTDTGAIDTCADEKNSHDPGPSCFLE
ncbi:hypothetical protein KHP62_17610 [Rhodobacteraceae bacterium NNCM2]|nr:hypothetical protein [Coraliihabitans acroporae]